MADGKRNWTRFIASRGALVRLGVLALVLAGLCVWGYWIMIRMPGRSWTGPLPPLSETEAALAGTMQADLEVLAGEIGPRAVLEAEALAAAADFLERRLAEAGYEVRRQCWAVNRIECCNLEVELTGSVHPEQIVVVGAHYDSVVGGLRPPESPVGDISGGGERFGACPGANDNGSGSVATVALAHRFAGSRPQRTLRFVLFVNEEPPYYSTDQMGSWQYARRCRDRGEQVVAMLSLETIGYYDDAEGSQKYPPPLGMLYPSTGNFIAFVGNYRSRKLVRQCIATFRAKVSFPSEGAALPAVVPGVGWSDHRSFWEHGYPALMVTDTAPFRYPHYHKLTDTPDQVDYQRMARVVVGLEPVIEELAGVRGNAGPGEAGSEDQDAEDPGLGEDGRGR